MKIRKDDNVIVISGKDRGKTGKVLKAMPKENKVLIAGVNVLKRHERPRKSGSKGQVIDKPMPVHVSNVMIVDPKDGKRTRVGVKVEANKKKVRVTKNSGATL
ncbi:MAG TPA: 50S ribosomal protein L24 [Candidatus Nanoarchaeia archaeon]|nr:50S ribosomal protein L24 [Candidatus Nanoarchaeia archaeon]